MEGGRDALKRMAVGLTYKDEMGQTDKQQATMFTTYHAKVGERVNERDLVSEGLTRGGRSAYCKLLS